MVIGSVHPIPVLVVAIITIIIGFVWYSKGVFGGVWASSMQLQESQLKPTPWHFLGAILEALVTAWVMAMFAEWQHLNTVAQGLVMGFFAWLGFVATTQFSGVIWAKVPAKTFLINTGCELASYLIMGGIFAVWR